MGARNPFGHIDLRVRSFDDVMPFYENLLPDLGLSVTFHGGGWRLFATDAPFPDTAYLAITEDPAHRPNATRIAFFVEDPAEVDRLADVARRAGAANVDGPRPMPYGPDYRAVYFDDPSGNRFEVYFRRAG